MLCLDETVQMKGLNIWFYAELTKIIPNYHPILLSRALRPQSNMKFNSADVLTTELWPFADIVKSFLA